MGVKNAQRGTQGARLGFGGLYIIIFIYFFKLPRFAFKCVLTRFNFRGYKHTTPPAKNAHRAAQADFWRVGGGLVISSRQFDAGRRFLFV